MIETLPDDWRRALTNRLEGVDLDALDQFVAEERQKGEVYPKAGCEFEALRLTPFGKVRAVILGQDPFHGPGQAHGLAFSTLGKKRPPSLNNILKELHSDCGFDAPEGGSLVPWAQHGVLLLNTVLTVRRGHAGSHAGHGWEQFTSAVVDAVAAKPGPIALLLWGDPAKTKGRLIDRDRHVVIECPHPSPLSAWRGFSGGKPFSRANVALQARGAEPINWSLG
jgi:uracil-DNA glycosylase